MTIDELNEVVDRCNCKDMDELIKLMDKYRFRNTIVGKDEYEAIMKSILQDALIEYSLNDFMNYVVEQTDTRNERYFMVLECDGYDAMYMGINEYQYDMIIEEFRDYLVSNRFLEE